MKKIHFVSYVDDSSPKLKKFNSIKALNKFVTDFQKKYHENGFNDGYWVDYIATNVGKLQLIDFYREVEE